MSHLVLRLVSLALVGCMLLFFLGGCGVILLRTPGTALDSTGVSDGSGQEQPGRPGSLPGFDDEPSAGGYRYVSTDHSAEIDSYLSSISTADYNAMSFFLASPVSSPLSGFGEPVGAKLSSALYERNRKVEDLLNIRLTVRHEDTETIAASVQASLNAEIPYADLLLLPSGDTGALAAERLLYNIRGLLYVDLDADYFNASSLSAFSAGIYVWAIAGDASLQTGKLPALYFNRDMLEVPGITLPYESVYENVWTWDAFFSCFAGLRGEDGYDYTVTDSFGEFLQPLFCAAGGQYVLSGIGKTPVAALSAADDTRVALLRRLLTGSMCYEPVAEEDSSAQTAFFEENRTLFCFGTLADATGYATSKARWGLLPLPMADEAQDGCRTAAPASSLVFAVPANTADIGLTGRVLSVLNAASYGNLLTAEADDRLAGGYRDNHSASMFLRIAGSVTFDFAGGLGAVVPGASESLSAVVRDAVAGVGTVEALAGERLSAVNAALAALTDP